MEKYKVKAKTLSNQFGMLQEGDYFYANPKDQSVVKLVKSGDIESTETPEPKTNLQPTVKGKK